MVRKDYEAKIKSEFIIYADFQFISVPGDNGKQNPKASYRTNIKSILYFMAINQFVFIINLGRLLRHTWAKMQHKIMISSKNVNIAVT